MNRRATAYSTGAGAAKNDLAALYWFDKAADGGIRTAKQEMSKILREYIRIHGRNNISVLTDNISKACETGTEYIPKDIEKANYWKEKGKRIAESLPHPSKSVTFGKHRYRYKGEIAEVILIDDELEYEKMLIDDNGVIMDFPGIEKGDWTRYLEGNFDEGQIRFRTEIHQLENKDGFRIIWEIQPDGMYWRDESGFGMTSDVELRLYADLDNEGIFKGPFRIYSIGDEKQI